MGNFWSEKVEVAIFLLGFGPVVLSGAFGVVVGFVVGVGFLCKILSPLLLGRRCISFLSLLLYPSPQAVLSESFFPFLFDDAGD